MDHPDAPSLASDIARLARLIEARETYLVSLRPTDGGRPYVWQEADGVFHWRVEERGRTVDSRTTRDLDELLYWAFDYTTAFLSSGWAAAHRVPGEEQRVTMFRHQFALLHTLAPHWARRRRAELLESLSKADRLPDGGLPPVTPSGA